MVSEELAAVDLGTGSVDKANDPFTSILHKAMTASCPRGRRPDAKPWWTPACTVAQVDARQALHNLRSNPCDETKGEHEAARWRLKETFRREKERTWWEYASTLDHRESVSKVYGTIRAMDGRSKSSLPDRVIQAAVYPNKE
jgi:hypothetical protein